MNQFGELLRALSRAIRLDPPLHPDRHQRCKLLINKVLPLQLEIDSAQENLLVASELFVIPPGKFRENVLKSALKANALPPPRIGTFAYIERKNELVLFEFLPLQHIQMEKMVSFLQSFIEKGESWRRAIESGQTAPSLAFPPSDTFWGNLFR